MANVDSNFADHRWRVSGIRLVMMKPGTERVQTLADISRSALRCHNNETLAPIANPPNRAQLEGTPTIPHVKAGMSPV